MYAWDIIEVTNRDSKAPDYAVTASLIRAVAHKVHEDVRKVALLCNERTLESPVRCLHSFLSRRRPKLVFSPLQRHPGMLTWSWHFHVLLNESLRR